jgi:hypothetical protein
MELSKAPRVFISYSWESEDHKQWVRYLGERLYQAGIEARLDQWFIKPGESFTVFMEQEVEQADFVIVVCTPAYAHKSNKRQGGVGYEQQIVSGQLMTGTSRSKFIPILRSGDYEPGLDCAVPTHFRGIAWIEFRNDAAFEESLEDLIRVIFSKPRFAPPPLGARPSLETITDTRLNRNRLTEAHESRELPDSNMEKGDSVKTAVKEADEAAIEVNNAAYSAVESETSGTTKSDRLDNVDGYGNRENAYSEETQLNRLDSSISPKALQSSELGSSSLATATYNLNDKNSDNVKAGLEEAGDTNSDVIETPLTSSQDTSLPNIKVARETKADDLHNTDILPSGKVHNRRQSLIPAAGISLVLLVAIIYAFIKYSSWQNVDIGFNPEGVLTLQLPSPPTKFFTLEDRRAFYTGLIERVASLPGVQSASVTTSLPLTDNDSVVDVAGRTEDTNGGQQRSAI